MPGIAICLANDNNIVTTADGTVSTGYTGVGAAADLTPFTNLKKEVLVYGKLGTPTTAPAGMIYHTFGDVAANPSDAGK